MSSSETSADPKVWGPALWKFLHSMAANYPHDPNPQYRASSRQFFYSLRHLLPCEMCRTHYSALISKRQPQTESAHALQEWVLWMHNEVNQRIKPDKPTWTMEQIKETYKPYAHANQTPPPSQSPARPLSAPRSTIPPVNVATSQPRTDPPVNIATTPDVKNILKPLEDLQSMLFGNSSSEILSPRSKTLSMSLESAKKLQMKMAEARRGISPTGQEERPKSPPASVVHPTHQQLKSHHHSRSPSPVMRVSPRPQSATPPATKFTSPSKYINRGNPLQGNPKPVKFHPKQIRPYRVRSNAARSIKHHTKASQHQKAVTSQPVTTQPAADCKDPDSKKDCGCGNK